LVLAPQAMTKIAPQTPCTGDSGDSVHNAAVAVHKHALSLVIKGYDGSLPEAQQKRLAAQPTALLLALHFKLCANWAAGGEAVAVACRLLRGQAVTQETMLKVVEQVHKARLDLWPSRAYGSGCFFIDSAVTQDSMKKLWHFVVDQDWCEALDPPPDVDARALVRDFEDVLTAVGGCKALELCHWHLLGRVRPALAYAMLQSIRDAAGAQYKEGTELWRALLSALFGTQVNFKNLHKEERNWLSYTAATLKYK